MSDTLAIAFWVVLGSGLTFAVVRSHLRTRRSRLTETPEEVRQRILREYEGHDRGKGGPVWGSGREGGGGCSAGFGCSGGGCGGGGN